MLKLVDAKEMDFARVEEYVNYFAMDVVAKWGNVGELFSLFLMKELENYPLTLVLDGEKNYMEYINESADFIMAFLVDDLDETFIIGVGVITFKYCDEGNISISIRKNMRKKGYGTELLNLLLKKCEELGMREVYVSCLTKNTASRNVIMKNGGEFAKKFYCDGNCLAAEQYLITLNPSISSVLKRRLGFYNKK